MSPDFSAVGGTTLAQVVGALLTIVLVAAVAAIILSAVLWAIGETSGNPHLAGKAKTGVLVALGTALLAGAGVAWANWLIHIGETL